MGAIVAVMNHPFEKMRQPLMAAARSLGEDKMSFHNHIWLEPSLEKEIVMEMQSSRFAATTWSE